MPKYYGCPCEGCGKPLTLQDDIVVCPDCGAPYHRVCYEKLGQCIHRPAHAAGYEWKFPYEESQLRTCPSCGERTLRDEETCRCCGAVLPPEGQEPPSSRGSGEETFDYSQMYRQFGTSADPEKEFFEDAFGKEAKMDGIDRQDWLDYIGPAAPAYLAAYSRMQLQKSKVSMSFSALLFGPFYFFYRKAWKPAFGFLAAELLLAAPTFIEMLQLSGSALAPAMSASALTVFARVCSVLSFVLMLVRGMYGKWLYRKSAADHIRRIQSEFPDAQQRQAVLRAQGKPANLIRIRNSRNVSIEGILLRDPAAWNTHIHYSDGVTIRDVKLINDATVPNTDGFDPDASTNVMIDHCFAYCSDDNVAVKTTNNLGLNKELQNVVVRSCVFLTRKSSLKVGTETKAARMSDILFEDNDIVECDRALALYCNDGALFENITFSNNRVERNYPDSQRRPIHFKISERHGKGRIRNVMIRNCDFATVFPRPAEIAGLDADHTIDSLTFSNVTIGGRPVRSLDDLGAKIRFTENIRFE